MLATLLVSQHHCITVLCVVVLLVNTMRVEWVRPHLSGCAASIFLFVIIIVEVLDELVRPVSIVARVESRWASLEVHRRMSRLSGRGAASNTIIDFVSVDGSSCSTKTLVRVQTGCFRLCWPRCALRNTLRLPQRFHLVK